MRNTTFGENGIEAYSDGVLAMGITLLVLEIKSPELHISTSSLEAWHTLIALAPKFASFVLSFLFITVFRVNHHRFFLFVRRFDWGLLWPNNLLLFLLCTIPFPTAFMGPSAQSDCCFPIRVSPASRGSRFQQHAAAGTA